MNLDKTFILQFTGKSESLETLNCKLFDEIIYLEIIHTVFHSANYYKCRLNKDCSIFFSFV